MYFTGNLIVGGENYGEAVCDLTVFRGQHGSRLCNGTIQASIDGLDAAFSNTSVVVQTEQGRELSIIVTRWQAPSNTADIKLSNVPEWLR